MTSNCRVQVPATGVDPPTLTALQLGAVCAGNALAFYDFLTFSFFAIQIGNAYFPNADPSSSLLWSLGTFAIGFITRPLGALVIGTYGDRRGRKPAMLLSFALMGVAMLGMAALPSYGQIGPLAPVLLVTLRLVQGFALGGEVGPSTAYLLEVAPRHRRGLFVALQNGTQHVAIFVAGLVGWCVATLLSPSEVGAWGWRIAFAVGVLIVPVGLAIRRHLPETLPDPQQATLVPGAAKTARLLIPISFVLLGATTIVTYVLYYMTTYAQDSLHMGISAAFGATLAVATCSIGGALTGGLLADRFGRKPVMLAAAGAMLVLVVPAFSWVLRQHSALALYVATGTLGFLAEVVSVPVVVTITERLPRNIRSRTLGVLYAVAIAACGGSTQYVVKRLIDATESALAPAWYFAVALALGALAMALLRERWPEADRGLITEAQ